MDTVTGVALFSEIFTEQKSITRDELLAKLLKVSGINAESAKWYISRAKLPVSTPEKKTRNLWDFQIKERKNSKGAKFLTRMDDKPLDGVSAKKPKSRPLANRRLPGTGEILIWGIPLELKKRFKIECLKREVSMTQAFIKFMEGYLNA